MGIWDDLAGVCTKEKHRRHLRHHSWDMDGCTLGVCTLNRRLGMGYGVGCVRILCLYQEGD